MTIAQDAETLWDEAKAWVSGEIKEAELFATTEGQEILAVLKPILAAAAPTALAALVGGLRTFLTGLTSVGSLADIETAILNVWQDTEPELFTLARSLGSNVVQAIVGLLLAQLPATI